MIMLPVAIAAALLGAASAYSSPAISVSSAEAPVDPVRLEKARDLVEVMHLQSQMHDMLRPMMMRMMSSTALGARAAGAPEPTRAQQETRDRGMTIMADEIEKIFLEVAPQMTEAATRAYARNLTTAELAATTAFYRSPEGQSVLAKQPLIMADMGNASQSIMLQPMIARMPAIIAKVKAASDGAPLPQTPVQAAGKKGR